MPLMLAANPGAVMLETKDWAWSKRPSSEVEFDAMLSSADEYLAQHGHLPHQRPMQAKVLVSAKLGFSAPLFRASWMNLQPEPFGPTDLLERVDDWYKNNYGKRLLSPFPARSFAVSLRSTLWRVHLPVVFGTVNITVDTDLSVAHGGGSWNLLHGIDDFTQAYANRLCPEEIHTLLESSKEAFATVDFLNELPSSGSASALAQQARLDYEHSVDALLSGFAWSKARWETAQCAEKVIKCLLQVHGHDFPKGRDGHDIPKLGALLEEVLVVRVDPRHWHAVHCEPKVRYGEEPVTAQSAYNAHRALLHVLASLSDSPTLMRMQHPDEIKDAATETPSGSTE
jgi:hypothetical protein